jgi:hypothetical protein
MFDKITPGFELLQKELDDLERLGVNSLPSLNAFLERHNLFMTQSDLKELKKIMTQNKKWKIVCVYDRQIVRRGKKK